MSTGKIIECLHDRHAIQNRAQDNPNEHGPHPTRREVINKE